MRPEYHEADLNALHRLFREAEDQLAASLLAGARWEQVTQQRKVLTDLAESIFEKYYPGQRFNKATFKYYVAEEECKPQCQDKKENDGNSF